MPRPALLGLLLLVLLPFAPGLTATAAGQDPGPTPTIGAPVEPPPAPPGPVAVPEPTADAVAFYRSGHALWVVRRLWEFAVPLAALATGLSVWLRDRARQIGRTPGRTVAVYVAAAWVLLAIVNLPLAAYAGFVRLHAYGLSTQTFPAWLLDQVKTVGFELLILVPSAVGVHRLIVRSPRRWWLLTGLITLPVVLGLALIKPVWIDPAFNRFGTMRDRALEGQILELARRAGVDGSRVFEVDKSRETKAVNAYVTGFLGTKRVVLWDTLVDRLRPDEVRVVMAHELGHYALNHVVQGLLVSSVLVLLGLYAVHRGAQAVLARWGDRLGGIRSIADVAALPLLFALGLAANLILSPVGYAFSRHLEREADRFALELTRDNAAAARAFVRLQEANLGYPRPGPVFTAVRATHPSLGDRIDFSNSYRPWERGEPLRYAPLMRPAAE